MKNKLVSEKRNENVLRYVDSILDKIDEDLADGRSVLIHCLAGAHRAGTTGVLFIMGKMKVDSDEGKRIAKKLRGIINPIGRLVTLLEWVDEAVIGLNRSKKINKSSRWYRATESE